MPQKDNSIVYSIPAYPKIPIQYPYTTVPAWEKESHAVSWSEVDYELSTQLADNLKSHTPEKLINIDIHNPINLGTQIHPAPKADYTGQSHTNVVSRSWGATSN